MLRAGLMTGGDQLRAAVVSGAGWVRRGTSGRPVSPPAPEPSLSRAWGQDPTMPRLASLPPGPGYLVL